MAEATHLSLQNKQNNKEGEFDDCKVAQTIEESWNQQQPTPYNQHQQQNLNEHMMSAMMGATPAQPTAALPPTPADPPDVANETPAIDLEVCEDVLIAIMGKDDATERGVALQRVYSGLTEKPCDAQIQKGDAVLNKKGKSAEKRLEGLVKLEKICMMKGQK